jgi:hypothetical protein
MRLPWLRIVFGSAAIVSCLASLAYEAPQESHAVTETLAQHPPQTASLPAWQPIPQPNPLIVVEWPAFADLPRTFEARRYTSGGREDILRFGAFEEPAGAHLHLTAAHAVEDRSRNASFFVELARWAASEGLAVARSGQASGVTTKLGTVEAADVVLAGGSERACLAFRLGQAGEGLRLSGWLCGSPEQPAGRPQLACLIDRLSVAPDAEDQTLKRLFAEAERLRSEACGPRVAQAAPVTAARKDSSSRRRAKAPARGNASRGSRG